MRSPAAVAHLKVTLDDVEPSFVRRLMVPLDLRLDCLHLVLQAALGWTNTHLWEFRARDIGWGIPDPEWDRGPGPLDARTITLRKLAEDTGAMTLTYLYDFADAWQHTVKIERIEPPRPAVTYPALIEAVGRRPPEDVGGPPGYEGDDAEISIGIDFGTTNTVVALAMPDGRLEAIGFDHGGERLAVYATALCFVDERRGAGRLTRVEGGPWAIDAFLETQHPHRFIQSFKTFAASASFQETRIFRERLRFENLLAAFLRTIARHADGALDLTRPRLVVGRPVRFAGHNPNDALAMERYRAGFGNLGAGHASYVYEPVGAAFFYARDLTADATVLVADFGGGTSDFSVLRFAREGGAFRATPLGHKGIGIAGDSFDYRIVDHVVSPRLGKGSRYRSLDKVLTVPNHLYANLARWHQLAMMKSGHDLKDLRDLVRVALDPEPLERFIDIVELDLGFALYRAVSRAKVALSQAQEVEFVFDAEGVAIRDTIARRDFERWIAADVQRIAETLDDAIASAGVAPEAIDRVFLTGGTSFVPAIRDLFVRRFGDAKLASGDQFESIAYGLALIGQMPDLARWSVSSR